jgi:hypothetical protein
LSFDDGLDGFLEEIDTKQEDSNPMKEELCNTGV